MSRLLHIDASARRESVSRRLSAEFAAVWKQAHPAGNHTYRDLAADPVPHVDEAQVDIVTRLETTGDRDIATARTAAETDAERRSWSLTWTLVDELLAADTIVIGTPMYNFSIPSSLKAWLDRVGIPPLLIDFGTGVSPLTGTRVTVVTARGGAYGPGTPREGSDFQEPYLRAAFRMLGLDSDLNFFHAELTKAQHVPHLAHLTAMAADSFTAAAAGARKDALRPGQPTDRP